MVHDEGFRGRQHHGLPHQQERHPQEHPQEARHLTGNRPQNPKRDGITAVALFFYICTNDLHKQRLFLEILHAGFMH